MTKPHRPQSNLLSRRHVLALGSGTALALIFSRLALARDPLSVDDFIALSAKLLQAAAGSLNGDNAKTYLSNFVALGQGDTLAALFDGTANAKIEQQILTDWYSGVHQTPNGETLVTYTDALIWNALDFTKPQGWCGGETGYWSEPPAGEA